MEFDPLRLAALRAAVETGTFEAAARHLHVTPSAISQRIKSLESETGRVLLQRSRPVLPTASGEVLLKLARQVEALGRDASATLGRDGLESGSPSEGDRLDPLPIAVNADSLATWLLPALVPLASEIAFELHRADESRTTELLRQGAVTAAITGDPRPVQGCSSTPLGAMRYRPMATSAFAERWFGQPGELAVALARAPVVVFDAADELQHRYLTAKGVDPAAPPCHYVPSSADFVEAIRLGFGWGLVPELQVADPGALVRIDPDRHIDVPLHWQQWQLHTSALARTAAAVEGEALTALVR